MHTLRKIRTYWGNLSVVNFLSFHGTVAAINDFFVTANNEGQDCYKLLSVENQNQETVNFVIAPTTYFVNHAIVSAGDQVTGYYDGNAPVPLIYPPQYRALIIVKEIPYQHVKVSYFNSQFVSADGQLKLNITPNTPILLINGQVFSKNPANRNLIVIYGPTTRSIPGQTTPYQIIVWC